MFFRISSWMISLFMILSLLPAGVHAQKPGAPPAVAPAPPPATNDAEKVTPTPVPEPLPPAAEPEPSADEPVSRSNLKQLDFLFTSDLYGRFYTPDCLGKQPRSYLQAIQLKIAELAPDLRPAGGKPVLIGGGNLFSPDAMGHFLLESTAGAAFIAGEYRKMGMMVNAYGPQDFLAPDKVLEAATGAFSKAEIPLLATNVECEKGQATRCRERLSSHQVIVIDGVRIGVIALFPEAQNARLPKAVRAMFKFTDPVKAYKAKLAELNKDGVHLVFLISHLDTEMSYPGGILGFLRGLDVAEPAVVFASQSQSPSIQNLGYIPLIKRNQGALIVGSSRFGRSLTRLRLAVLPGEKGGFVVDPSATEAMDIPVPVRELAADDPGAVHVGAFCEAFNKPLGNNVIEKPMELEPFLAYMLGVMRTTERTELAVINRDVLNHFDFPVSGPVTREMIARLIRTDSALVVLNLKGKDIKTLLGAFADSTTGALKVLGLEKTKAGLTINNRDIEDDLHYAVVTTQFVASGGGGIIAAQTGFDPGEKGVRTLMMEYFEGRTGKARGLDASSDFPDLWKNYVWNGGGNVGITFGHSNVFHTGVYADKPKLMGQDLTSMNVDITIFTGISNVTHALTGRARLLYGKTWTTQVDELGQTTDVDTESADEVKLNLLYQLKSPKNSWWKGSWWAPIPFVDIGYLTEFTPSLRDESYRAKLFTGILGLGMEVWESRLFFKAGAGMRREYGEEDVKAQNTLYAGWQLNNGDVFKVFGQGVKGESRLDGYVLDSDGEPLNYEIQMSNKLYFALNNRIFFSFTHEAYALKRDGERWSFAMDFLFGFNVLFDVRVPFIVY